MTPFEQITYEIIKELQDKCVAEHCAPVCVNMHEITDALRNRAKAALNGLVKNGVLAWHQNINGIPMFTIQNLND